ncbi:MAG: 7-cyano-7-deazaguanine synthase QueC [Paludibacteraceae bacterium]|nr:7-cyano-7-deazaguanine synthase QueC [Paludibacteraceae bacterium]MBN2787905.1 7-cyano-7-deazaguanine synthase QueC [Paludibacteraceae bacterium]
MSEFKEKAYLLLSGGQDSFVCLAWALQRFGEVEAVSILYNQRHAKELEYAAKIAKHFGIKHTMYNIGDFFSAISDSSLLTSGNHFEQHQQAKNLPASFVPNRNGLFLTIISNHAFRNDEAHIHIVAGVCETDYSGYPDCRHQYIKAKEAELSLGLERAVTIHTPLMWKTKSQTFQMAADALKLKELIEMTLSCYNGVEDLHEWGRGCTECPACKIRMRGYEEYKKLAL